MQNKSGLLKALEILLEPTPGKTLAKSTESSSEDTEPRTGRIVDTTDQYMGKSLIITDATLPEE
jgi:hypothetical protein